MISTLHQSNGDADDSITGDPIEYTEKTSLHDPEKSTTPLSFEDLLSASHLPPPGPAHYAARRALWLAPRGSSSPRHSETSSSRKRLEMLLNSPNAVNNDQVWKGGVEKVWRGLNAGGSLKRMLPMGLVVSTLIEYFAIFA